MSWTVLRWPFSAASSGVEIQGRGNVLGREPRIDDWILDVNYIPTVDDIVTVLA